jgi:hypothetical protein
LYEEIVEDSDEAGECYGTELVEKITNIEFCIYDH